MTPAWAAMPRAASLWLYGRTDGVFSVQGIPESPYTVRTRRADLVAQVEADRAIIEGMRR